MENIPADYWLILCIIDYWLAPFTQNHISILTLQSVSTGGLAPGISLEKKIANVDTLNVRVSMPSRAYTSFLQMKGESCYPLFLQVSMPSRAYTSFLLARLSILFTFAGARCQCPLGLIPHFYLYMTIEMRYVGMCQCPLGLIPHFYSDNQCSSIKKSSWVSMPSRAYTSFLQQDA